MRRGAALDLGLPAEGFGAIHDPRCDEDDELVADVARTAALEQDAEDRDVAEEGHLIEVSAGVAGEDSADDRSVPVEDEKIRLRLALQDRRVTTRRGLVEVRLVAVDL